MPKKYDVTDLDPELEEDDEEVEEEGDTEEEEEDEIEEAAPPPKPEVPRPAVGMGSLPKGAGTRPKRAPRRPANQAPRKPREWDYREVELLWPELLSCIGKPGHELQNETIGNVEIRVRRLDPPPAMVVGRLEAAAVTGGQGINPGDALIDAIDNYCHVPMAPYGGQAARYDVLFVWKAGPNAGKVIARGEAMRPSVDTLMAKRRAEYDMRSRQSATGFGNMPSFDRSAPMAFQQPQPYPPFMLGGSGMDPNTRYLMETLVAQLNESNRQLAEVRGQPAPPPVGMPAPLPMNEDTLVDKVVAKLAPMLGRAVGLGAAQGQNGDAFQTMASELIKDVTGQTFAKIKESFKVGLSEALDPREAAPEPEPVEEKKVSDPREDLPYRAIELESRWADGRKVVFPKAKDGTGFAGVSLVGLLAENPWLVERATEVVSSAASGGIRKVTDAIGVAAQRMVAGTTQEQQLSAPSQQQQVIDTTGVPVAQNGTGNWPQQ